MKDKLVFRFNRLFVVESLPDGELSTGKMLIEDINPLITASSIKFKIELKQVATRRDLFNFFQDVAVAARQSNLLPMMHWEIHGNEDKTGIVLRSGECVSWLEMKPILTEINVAVRNNLLITLAVCSGAHLIFIVWPWDRAPVFGLVGPVQAVTTEAVMDGYSAYYKELFSSFDANAAWNELNNSVDHPYDVFDFLYCEYLFREVYKQYLSEYNAKEAAARLSERLKDYPVWKEFHPRARQRRIIKETKELTRPMFEKYREKFFMYDLHPENRNRFEVHYEEIFSSETEN
jgi:hypothetical protein